MLKLYGVYYLMDKKWLLKFNRIIGVFNKNWYAHTNYKNMHWYWKYKLKHLGKINSLKYGLVNH